jgi:hypothetical protein
LISSQETGAWHALSSRYYPAVPPAESSHRNRKKCRPQREHRYGRKSQWSTFSIAFRTPTLLKSTDLQCGQRAENTPYSTAIRQQYA